MAKSPFLFDSFSFISGEKKNLSPDFGVMVFFFGLGRFLNLLGRGTSQVFFFDKRPLNVGRRVEINLKLIDMAFGCDVR